MTARRTLVADNTYRSCSRCGLELTDPASRECGVGPICRAKDNHLYAKLISANLPVAASLLYGTHPEELHEDVAPRFMALCEAFTKKATLAQSKNEDMFNLNLTGSDFRDEVRELDFILSYRSSLETRKKLIGVVRALGYAGLAAVLSGDASKSKAKVWFESGRVFLQGTGCTPGWRKMKQIPGIKTPRYRGEKAPYSAPAQYAKEFFDVVIEHWPLYDEDLDNLKSQAEAFVAANPIEEVTQIPEGPFASITIRSHDFVLSFPWVKDKNMRGMIDSLKRIPGKERAYDPTKKDWLFKKNRFDEVKAIAAETFETVTVTVTEEETPADKWVKHNPYPTRRRSSYHRRGYY